MSLTKYIDFDKIRYNKTKDLGKEVWLLNAGKTTNFIYEIDSYKPTPEEIEIINNIESKSKIKDRIEAIRNKGGSLSFRTVQNDIFKNNLVLIDSLLPNILSEIVKVFFTSKLSTVKDLTKNINEANPINYDKQFSHAFYEYKIKRLLTEAALGLQAAKVWTGTYDATGGYLIVKENGDVLCYHIYKRNQFEDYLYANTKLETSSSSRHEFGKIYEQEGKFYFKLNLQIRFK